MPMVIPAVVAWGAGALAVVGVFGVALSSAFASSLVGGVAGLAASAVLPAKSR